MSLLAKTMQRARVEIIAGRLIVTPNDKSAQVPANWLSQNRGSLTREILSACGVDGYAFQFHSTGLYKMGEVRRGGVTLQFVNLRTGESAHAIFNAQTFYERASKKHKAGDRYPSGKFLVKKNSGFLKFWIMAGLSPPKSLSRFDSYIGNLKNIVFDFVVDPSKKNKIVNSESRLMNIFHELLMNNLLTSNEQFVNKDCEQGNCFNPDNTGPTDNFECVQNNYGSRSVVIRKHGNTDLSSTTESVKAPQQQSNEEWLSAYES